MLGQRVQAVVIQGLELGQLVVGQQSLAHAGGVGRQAAALHRDGTAAQRGLHLFEVIDIPVFQAAEVACLVADRHDVVHQAVDLPQGAGFVQIGVSNAERHAADAVMVVLVVQGQVAAVPQGVQQRGDAAFGNAQMLRQLGKGVTAAVQAAQLQNIQRACQGTVGISGRHGSHFLSLYIGPLRGIRTRSGKRRKCSDVFRTGILKTPDVFGYRAVLELAFRYLNKNCALSGSDG